MLAGDVAPRVEGAVVVEVVLALVAPGLVLRQEQNERWEHDHFFTVAVLNSVPYWHCTVFVFRHRVS